MRNWHTSKMGGYLLCVQNKCMQRFTLTLLCLNCHSKFSIWIHGAAQGLCRNDLIKSLKNQICNLFQYSPPDTNCRCQRELRDWFYSAEANRNPAAKLLAHQYSPREFDLHSLYPARAYESLGPLAFQPHYEAHPTPTKWFSRLYEENCDIRFVEIVMVYQQFNSHCVSTSLCNIHTKRVALSYNSNSTRYYQALYNHRSWNVISQSNSDFQAPHKTKPVLRKLKSQVRW